MDINLLVTQFINELLINFPTESHPHVSQEILNQVIINLGDSNATLRKSSHQLLLSLVRALRSFDEICNNFIKTGFESSNVTALACLPPLIPFFCARIIFIPFIR